MNTEESLPVVFKVSDALSAQIQDVSAELNALPPCASDDDATRATALLKKAKGVVNDISKARKSYTSKLDAMKKHLIEQERAFTEPLEKAIALKRGELDAFIAERTRLAIEAQKKAIEAARQAHEDSELQARAAQAFGVPEEAGEADAVPESLQVLSPAELQSLEKLKGVSVRTVLDYEVVDASLLPREFLTPNHELIKARLAFAQKAGETPEIPGLRIFSRVATALR